MAAGEDQNQRFTLGEFLPYMLNQAAEAVSRSFQEHYRREGLSRTQWRVMAHLDAEAGLTAREICRRSHEEKVAVSRAVAALEGRGFLIRARSTIDRRSETLSLSQQGRQTFDALAASAASFEAGLATQIGKDRVQQVRAMLQELLPLLEQLPDPDRRQSQSED